jgi:3',5'-cyclic AMP phosphodiesterase CpdA
MDKDLNSIAGDDAGPAGTGKAKELPQFELKRVAWVSDLHLNFCGEKDLDAFLALLAAERPEALLVGGDTGEAPSVEGYLQALARRLAVPVFFVLGNHDFYRGSVASVRRRIEALAAGSSDLHWLSRMGAVEIATGVGLVGHDAWADGGYGDYASSRVRLSDHWLIEDLAGLDSPGRLRVMKALGEEAAGHLRSVLPEALERFEIVLVLTHVPPFEQATWHEGRISDRNYLPHFSCKSTGDVLLSEARRRPDRKLLVLCGHTHSSGRARLLPNLAVETGAAVYGAPAVERLLDLGDLASFFR